MKHIRLILTGGTFGMASQNGSPLKVSEIENRLFDIIPELQKLAELSTVSVFSIDSSNIQPSHWVILAEQIERDINHFDGFVIVHGTDTMAYTASALSFMLSGLKKPVILTGSQRPLNEIRSDARLNLINAVELATLNIPEVAICFNNTLFRGNRAKKTSVHRFDAFQSPNFESLASIGTQIELSDKIIRPQGMFQTYKHFDVSVVSFPLFPGVRASDMMYLAKSNLKAIVLEAFGAGNVPIMDNSFLPFISELTKRGKIVAIGSQCARGKVDLNLYEGGSEALNVGAIGCSDMTRSAALVKLMFLLGNFPENIELVKENFCRSIAGELTI